MLMATGAVLLLLGFLGYLVQALGDWGAALLALAGVLFVVAIVTVFGSTTVRMRARRALEEHLFAHKYDYREEWRRVTEQLTEPSPDYDLPQQVLRALGGVLRTTGGAVWRLSGHGLLVPLSQLHTLWNQPFSPRTSQQLQAFFERQEWVLDLEDLPPAARTVVVEAGDLTALPGIRFLVPLMTEKRLFGVAALTAPPGAQALTWEDYDVIKLIARQSSGFIALREAERELADADKLRSFNQVSAFIVHDVKTISSQLSLLTQNAEKHKSNPAFIDDMIATVGNAVERMQKLLTQLREGDSRGGEIIDLGDALQQTVKSFGRQCPVPELRLPATPVTVAADPSKLRSAVGHLIQNAIDAANLQAERTRCRPRVAVALAEHAPWAEVTVEDSGPGMDAQFIDKELFQPFTSTKGVAGMGVGAYQARSYVRSLGGDVSVDSRPDHGARFIIRLPLKTHHD
jgi:putative PEP-CTERM system histidine kinase